MYIALKVPNFLLRIDAVKTEMCSIQGQMMINSIVLMQEKFEEIKMVIGNDFSIEHLDDKAFVESLAEVVEETYILLNGEMCHRLEVCQQCASHRDQMQKMVVVLDDILEGSEVTQKIGSEFSAFSVLLDNVITRTKELFKEHSPAS